MILDELLAEMLNLNVGNKNELINVQMKLIQISHEAWLPEAERQKLLIYIQKISFAAMGQNDAIEEELEQLTPLLCDLKKFYPKDETLSAIEQDPLMDEDIQTQKTNDAIEKTDNSGLDAITDDSLVDREILDEFINEAEEHFQVVESNLLELDSDPNDQEMINGIFRAFHSAKGMAGLIGLEDAKTLAHKAEELIARARKNEIQLIGIYADLAFEASDTLKQIIEDLKNYKSGPLPLSPDNIDLLIQKLDNPEKYSEISIKSSSEVTSQMSNFVSESTIDSSKINELKMTDIKQLGKKVTNSKSQSNQDQMIRVSTSRLDRIIDMVGEIVITNSMIAQDEYIVSEENESLTTNVMQLSKTARELQDLGIALRMIPLKQTFQKMERLVRELVRFCGKSVKIVTEGEDTEIDRNMVESLSDPLVHMIRNAIDHGIEDPDEREANGKTRAGTIILKASHSAGNILIELIDNGRGLDPEKILSKAIHNGVVPEGKEMDPKEIYKLIFEPGFSTAEQITDISGRGVGMDVVKKNIESLRGRVDINSQKGEGTTFSIKIPLTLAIIDGLLLKVGDHEYLIPTLNVKTATQPESTMLSSITGRGEMLNFREQFIPIFRLHEIFDLHGAQEDPTNALLVVVEHDNEMCALLADELLGQFQVVIKSMGDGLANMESIAGAAILGDGRIRLIIDVAGVLSLARTQDNHIDHDHYKYEHSHDFDLQEV